MCEATVATKAAAAAALVVAEHLKMVHVGATDGDVMCVKFTSDGDVLAVGTSSGQIQLLSPESLSVLASLDPSRVRRKLAVTSLRFCSLDRLLVATYASGDVLVWNLDSKTVEWQLDERRQTLCADVCGTALRTAGNDGVIYEYDLGAKTRCATYKAGDCRHTMDGHRTRILALTHHPKKDGEFISGGWDDTVQFWDSRVSSSIRHFCGPHICGDALDVNANSNEIVTGSWRRNDTVEVWDYARGIRIHSDQRDIKYHCLVYCAQFVDDNTIVCAGGDRNVLRLLDRKTMTSATHVTELPASVYCCDVTTRSTKPLLAAGCGRRIYELSVERKQTDRIG